MAEKLAARLAELRSELKLKANPHDIAAHSGAEYKSVEGTGLLRLSLFGQFVHVTFPDLVACDAQTDASLPDSLQVLLLYYLNTADGTPIEGRWVSFADLPDGRFYNQAYQGYTGKELARHFGNDIDSFAGAACKLDGMPIACGDAGFVFYALPRVWLAVVAHRGDEDFPPSYQILFDASVSHYLPTDVCAILGSMLTRKLINVNSARSSLRATTRTAP